jgi:hypothetical protein
LRKGWSAAIAATGLFREQLIAMTTIIAEEKPVGTTRIHCPACHARNVEAVIIERAEKVTEMLVVHMSTHTTWWVVCNGCKVRLYSKVSGSELAARTADQLVGVVVPRVGGVRQFWAVASILLSFFPFMGISVALIAYFLNRKSIGWPRTASKIGLGLAIFFIVALIALIIINPKMK